MSTKQVIKKVMEHLTNGNGNKEKKTSNNIIFEPYVNKNNNVEQYYIPFIDINYNKNPVKNAHITSNPKFPNDILTKIYIVGLSCLGLYMLNSLIKKK